MLRLLENKLYALTEMVSVIFPGRSQRACIRYDNFVQSSGVLLVLLSLNVSYSLALEHESHRQKPGQNSPSDSQKPGVESFRQGQSAFKNGDLQTAIAAFRKAIAENPDLLPSYSMLGRAYERLGDYEAASTEFLRVLERQPDVDDAVRRAGLTLARTENPARAIPYLEKAIETRPNDQDAHYSLAVVLMNTDRSIDAEKHFSKVIQLAPEAGRPHYFAYYFAGRLAYERKELQIAKDWLDKFLQLEPESVHAPNTHFMLGRIALREAESLEDTEGRYEEAVSHLTKLVEIDPNSPHAPEAYYILGTLAARQEDTESARLHFEKYLTLRPQGPKAEEVKQYLADRTEGEDEGS